MNNRQKYVFLTEGMWITCPIEYLLSLVRSGEISIEELESEVMPGNIQGLRRLYDLKALIEEELAKENASVKYNKRIIKSSEERCTTYEPAPESEERGDDVRDFVPDGTATGNIFSALGGLIVGGIASMFSAGDTSDNSDDDSPLEEVYSSIFAPAEVKPKSWMLVQVYLHLFEETEKVKNLARESQKDAERRDYIPLQCRLKKGDEVDVQLNVYNEKLLVSESRKVVWRGSLTKCSFNVFVPEENQMDELLCVAMLCVNGVPVGEMRFITNIVAYPRRLNPEVIAHKFKKVFISYSHKDEEKVKFLHKGLEVGDVPHFFDRSYLRGGDIYPQVIHDYIESADLFILCWSKNASQSEYVQKERMQALERAYPNVTNPKTKLEIYPMDIEPRADLPTDMKEYYHFVEI